MTPPRPPLQGEGDPLPDIEGKMIIERLLKFTIDMIYDLRLNNDFRLDVAGLSF